MLLFHESASLSAKYFNTLSDKSVPVNALKEWLSSAPIVTNTDVIAWWTAMHATDHPLALMALDFLSIPGMILLLLFGSLLSNIWLHSNIYRC
jgi:hypothetical protein